jgi:hypothetical protein
MRNVLAVCAIFSSVLLHAHVDECALNAVRELPVPPATLTGQKVAGDINLEVSFANR